MANVAQPPLFYLASFPPLGPDIQQPSSILALPFSLFKWFSFYFPFLAIKFVMHHFGFPFRCTFCVSHVPRKGKKHIMENASNICWHNCCLSISPPLLPSHFHSPGSCLPTHFPSSHLFCNSIDRWIYHSLGSLPFNGCLLKILCNVCKGKPQEYETILKRHLSGRIYKKYRSMFRREFRFILFFLPI